MDKFNMYALVMDSLNDGAPICVHAVCEDDVINYCFYRDGNGGYRFDCDERFVNNDGIRYLNSEWENVHTSIEEICRLIDEYDEWYEGWCSVDCDI